MCFSPQPRAICEHRNFQNGSAPVVFSTFWFTNMLLATAACNFWTSQLPKRLRPCGVFHILTYKYASRHSGVQFLNITTSKMAPPLWCFPHFDLQICFSPQRRAIFEHRNVQNGSAPVVFCAFWLANVLRATAACHFSPVCQNSHLRTRRFSEATFRTSATTNHWKNTAIRDFTNIFRACWTPCYWLCTPVDLLAPDSTHMLIFLLLTWLLCDSSLQLYILSEVRLLNFLRISYPDCTTVNLKDATNSNCLRLELVPQECRKASKLSQANHTEEPSQGEWCGQDSFSQNSTL